MVSNLMIFIMENLRPKLLLENRFISVLTAGDEPRSELSTKGFHLITLAEFVAED